MSQQVNPKIIKYIEGQIFPFYQNFVKCHNVDHIEYVIKRSLEFAKQVQGPINIDMVYVIAAYHDIGNAKDRATHHLVSAQMLRDDKELKKYFTPEEIETMAEAIEDHRASGTKDPRGVYGKIVSSADRTNNLDEMIHRMYEFRMAHKPRLTLAELINDQFLHLVDKYGGDGYANSKMYFDDPDFDKFVQQTKALALDKDAFEEYFMSWLERKNSGQKTKFRPFKRN